MGAANLLALGRFQEQEILVTGGGAQLAVLDRHLTDSKGALRAGLGKFNGATSNGGFNAAPQFQFAQYRHQRALGGVHSLGAVHITAQRNDLLHVQKLRTTFKSTVER